MSICEEIGLQCLPNKTTSFTQKRTVHNYSRHCIKMLIHFKINYMFGTYKEIVEGGRENRGGFFSCHETVYAIGQNLWL